MDKIFVFLISFLSITCAKLAGFQVENVEKFENISQGAGSFEIDKNFIFVRTSPHHQLTIVNLRDGDRENIIVGREKGEINRSNPLDGSPTIFEVKDGILLGFYENENRWILVSAGNHVNSPRIVPSECEYDHWHFSFDGDTSDGVRKLFVKITPLNSETSSSEHTILVSKKFVYVKKYAPFSGIFETVDTIKIKRPQKKISMILNDDSVIDLPTGQNPARYKIIENKLYLSHLSQDGIWVYTLNNPE